MCRRIADDHGGELRDHIMNIGRRRQHASQFDDAFVNQRDDALLAHLQRPEQANGPRIAETGEARIESEPGRGFGRRSTDRNGKGSPSRTIVGRQDRRGDMPPARHHVLEFEVIARVQHIDPRRGAHGRDSATIGRIGAEHDHSQPSQPPALLLDRIRHGKFLP